LSHTLGDADDWLEDHVSFRVRASSCDARKLTYTRRLCWKRRAFCAFQQARRESK